MQHNKVLILDFGSQYTQLIARRVRELNIYCEIHPFNKIPELDSVYKGVILSGSPFSVTDENALIPDLEKIIERVRSTKIGNIIYYLKNSIEKDDKVILFSQWDEMLHKVGDLLKDTGINIVYCNVLYTTFLYFIVKFIFICTKNTKINFGFSN